MPTVEKGGELDKDGPAKVTILVGKRLLGNGKRMNAANKYQQGFSRRMRIEKEPNRRRGPEEGSVNHQKKKTSKRT